MENYYKVYLTIKKKEIDMPMPNISLNNDYIFFVYPKQIEYYETNVKTPTKMLVNI